MVLITRLRASPSWASHKHRQLVIFQPNLILGLSDIKINSPARFLSRRTGNVWHQRVRLHQWSAPDVGNTSSAFHTTRTAQSLFCSETAKVRVGGSDALVIPAGPLCPGAQRSHTRAAINIYRRRTVLSSSGNARVLMVAHRLRRGAQRLHTHTHTQVLESSKNWAGIKFLV